MQERLCEKPCDIIVRFEPQARNNQVTVAIAFLIKFLVSLLLFMSALLLKIQDVAISM